MYRLSNAAAIRWQNTSSRSRWICASGHGGEGNDRNALAATAGGRRISARICARELDRMGGVNCHRRAQILHLLDTQHVDYKVVVTKRYAALTKDRVIARNRLADLVQNAARIQGGQELTFFDMQQSAGRSGRARRCDNKIGLTAKERWNLHEICNR
eukprot:gene46589-62311_t